VNARSNSVWFTYHEGTRSSKSMIKIQKDVGCVLSEAAEGEERHRDLISTGKHQYIARPKQAWIGWKIWIQGDGSAKGSSTACQQFPNISPSLQQASS
jgi:hypothetical protein